MSADGRRMLLGVTVPMTANAFLQGQIGHLADRGWTVTLVCSPGPEVAPIVGREPVHVETVPMARRIQPLADLRSLVRLIRLLRRLRPDVSNVGTPKAGLLLGVAAALTRVPWRVYTVRGLPLETASGLRRKVLWCTELISIRCAHHVVCVSPSLRARLEELRLVDPRQVTVPGHGSSNGVRVERFGATAELREAARALRAELGIPADAAVVGFVGRLNRDKGVTELVAAWQLVSERRRDAWLLLIGDPEPADPLPEQTVALLTALPRIAQRRWLPDPAPVYLAMDVLALPTHREGFPNVALEAAAAGRPVVTTDATGAVDAVIDGRTGLVVPVGDVDALAGALERLLADPAAAAAMGAAGATRVRDHFRPEQVWADLDAVYERRPTAGVPR